MSNYKSWRNKIPGQGRETCHIRSDRIEKVTQIYGNQEIVIPAK